MRIRHGLAAACALWLSTVASAQAGLISNGSFEEGVNPGAFSELPAGSSNINGWTITRGSVDYIGTLWNASDGERSVDLDGNNQFGGISQDIATVVGEEYEVTFDLAGNPYGPPAVKQLRLSANSQSQDFTFDATNSTSDDMGWLEKAWRFVADSDVTTIWFQSLNHQVQENGSYGAAIDNVAVNHVPRVADTPEPSTLALGVIASLGLLGWRRRR